MPVSSTIGPSGSGGEGQLIPGGAVGARPGPRPAPPGAGCCASTAIPVNTSVKANTRIRIESFSLNVGSHYMPYCYCSSPATLSHGRVALECELICASASGRSVGSGEFGLHYVDAAFVICCDLVAWRMVLRRA